MLFNTPMTQWKRAIFLHRLQNNLWNLNTMNARLAPSSVIDLAKKSKPHNLKRTLYKLYRYQLCTSLSTNNFKWIHLQPKITLQESAKHIVQQGKSSDIYMISCQLGIFNLFELSLSNTKCRPCNVKVVDWYHEVQTLHLLHIFNSLQVLTHKAMTFWKYKAL